MMIDIEEIVNHAIESASDIYGNNELLEDFELELRRRVMKSFSTSTKYKWPPDITFTPTTINTPNTTTHSTGGPRLLND